MSSKQELRKAGMRTPANEACRRHISSPTCITGSEAAA